MSACLRCHHRTILEECNLHCTSEGRTTNDTPKPLSSPRSLPICGLYIGKALLQMILLILTASIFCALFDLGLMVAKNFIIEAYISRWKMEMRSFSMGPPPAWLDDPPEDFLHLPPGSDEYANFSLSLMVQNNPYWLKVEVFSVNMMVFGHNLASFYAEGAAISEDGKLSLAQKVPLDSVYEGAYLCLRYLFSTEQLVPLEIYFEAEFSFFGHRSNTFELATKVNFEASAGGNYRDHHTLSPWEEVMARNCWQDYHSERASILRVPHFGEVIAFRANYRPASQFILL